MILKNDACLVPMFPCYHDFLEDKTFLKCNNQRINSAIFRSVVLWDFSKESYDGYHSSIIICKYISWYLVVRN